MGFRRKIPRPSADQVLTLDRILSSYRPFGDSQDIEEQYALASLRHLRLIGRDVPSAARLAANMESLDAETRYRYLGNTVVRCCIERSLRRALIGGDTDLSPRVCDEIFQDVNRSAEAGEGWADFATRTFGKTYLDGSRHHTQVWDSGSTTTLWREAFRDVVIDEYGAAPLTVPTPEQLAVLRSACELLEQLLPLTSKAALTHTHMVVTFEGTGSWALTSSSSSLNLCGTIFLRQASLRNPWWAAEALLHEALHLKLGDFRHGYSLLREELFDEEDAAARAAKVVVPWNRPGLNEENAWGTYRAVAAFHVYTHLSLLCSVAEEKSAGLAGRFGPSRGEGLPSMTDRHAAFERAQYLASNIPTTAGHELGRAGRLLVEWLRSIMKSLDPSPPPEGVYTHLLVSRYRAEAQQVARRSWDDRALDQLAEVAEDEIRTVREILDLSGNKAVQSRFDMALSRADTDGRPSIGIPELRRIVVDAISELPADGCRLGPLGSDRIGLVEVGSPDEIFAAMVERSSRSLARIGSAPSQTPKSPSRPGPRKGDISWNRESRVPPMLYGTAWMAAETSPLSTAAIEAGFDGIDTANQLAHYDESAVGEAVDQAVGAGSKTRSDLFLQTKFTHPHHHQGRALPYAAEADPPVQVRQSLASSLNHLRTEYVDCYLLHGPEGPGPLGDADREVWTTMAELARTAEVGLIGVSNVSPGQLEEICDLSMPDVVQNRFRLGHSPDIEVRRLCRERGITYQGFSVIAANRVALDSVPVRTVSLNRHRSAVQVLVGFAIQRGVVPVIGTTSPAHMDEVLAAGEIDLDPEEMNLLATLDEPVTPGR